MNFNGYKYEDIPAKCFEAIFRSVIVAVCLRIYSKNYNGHTRGFHSLYKEEKPILQGGGYQQGEQVRIVSCQLCEQLIGTCKLQKGNPNLKEIWTKWYQNGNTKSLMMSRRYEDIKYYTERD